MIRAFLERQVRNGVFPGCAYAIVSKDSILEEGVIGSRTVTPDLQPMKRMVHFDMASLSKILGPTMIALRLKKMGELDFSIKVGDVLSYAGNYGDVTINNLLLHTGGFLPELPLWKDNLDKKDFILRILDSPIQYKQGTDCVYSCLGYIVLGEVLETITKCSLDHLSKELVWKPLGMNETTYNPSPDLLFAPTEYKNYCNGDCWNGIVHDENARSILPSCSGNAGVFSTIGDMAVFAKWILIEMNTPNLLLKEDVESFEKDLTPFSKVSRTYGFLSGHRGTEYVKGSVAGKKSIGHTGFTGTSLWIDGEKGIAAVLLTNRVHPTRNNVKWRFMLPSFHDLVFREYGENNDQT